VFPGPGEKLAAISAVVWRHHGSAWPLPAGCCRAESWNVSSSTTSSHTRPSRCL